MNHSNLVVDASVAIKWLLPEPGSQQAVRILSRYQQGDVNLIAPHLLLSDVSSGLSKRVRRGEVARQHAETLFNDLLLYSPILLDSPSVSRSALHLALLHSVSPYDCLYLAWALEKRCDLITADEKLFRTMGSTYTCVRSL